MLRGREMVVSVRHFSSRMDCAKIAVCHGSGIAIRIKTRLTSASRAQQWPPFSRLARHSWLQLLKKIAILRDSFRAQCVGDVLGGSCVMCWKAVEVYMYKCGCRCVHWVLCVHM